MGRGAWQATVHGAAKSDAIEHTHNWRSLVNTCRGPASAGSRGYPQDERRRRVREKTRETSLDRVKSVFYFLTTGFIPLLRTFSRYKMLTHAYTGLVLHHFVF